MKLSERFDRRYQQTPATGPQTPITGPENVVPGPLTSADGVATIAPVERRVVSRDLPAVPADSADPRTADLPTVPEIRAVKVDRAVFSW